MLHIFPSTALAQSAYVYNKAAYRGIIIGMSPKKSKSSKKKSLNKQSEVPSTVNVLPIDSSPNDISRFTYSYPVNDELVAVVQEISKKAKPQPSVASSSSSSSPLIPDSPEQPPELDQAAHAADLKEEGNKAFKAGDYLRSIDLYTSAIGSSILYTSNFSNEE